MPHWCGAGQASHPAADRLLATSSEPQSGALAALGGASFGNLLLLLPGRSQGAVLGAAGFDQPMDVAELFDSFLLGPDVEIVEAGHPERGRLLCTAWRDP